MTQFVNTNNSRNMHFFSSDPRAIQPFIHSLFSSLFYLMLSVLCVLFLASGVESWQQTPATVPDMPLASITSLERGLDGDGGVHYSVTYTYSPPEVDSPQAVLIQQERIPAALFYRLRVNDLLPVVYQAGEAQPLRLDGQLLENSLSSPHSVPLLMVGLGILGLAASGVLLARSVIHTIQSYQLNRFGKTTYAVVVRREMRTFEDREAEYILVYQFQPDRNRQNVEKAQLVSLPRYRSTQSGEVLRVRYIPQAAHVSRIEF
ncbi:MAG: hypothetical protein CVU39_23035 [Chloroflexi bacterium HGW-Chloroflexi-10]|nr:MAG: hypothetical protein CVU39_23035 [Chloroflexi bacterium HGW-Chloroflexi-10]